MAFALAAACGTDQPEQPALHLVQNGGFETGDFTGWARLDSTAGTGGFYVVGDVVPVTGQVVRPPPEGAYAAVTDQDAAGTHILYQDVVLPPERTATLRLTIYLLNAATDYMIAPTAGLAADHSEPNQQFRVDVMDPTEDVTTIGFGMYRYVYQTRPGDSLATGYRTLTADLTAFAGRTVRIRLAEVDNQGHLFVGVDAVDVEVTN
jgi:hypothetical protein